MPSLTVLRLFRQLGQHALQFLVVLCLVDELGGDRSIQRIDAGHPRIGLLAVLEQLAQQAAVLVHHFGRLLQFGVGYRLADNAFHESAKLLHLGIVLRLGEARLYFVGHRQVVVPLHRRHVLAPGVEGLAILDAGLGQRDTIAVVVAAEQALSQRVAAEGAEHAEDVRLGDVLRFVRAEHPHRQHVGRNQEFLGRVGAHGRHHLAARAGLPRLGVVVPLLVPLFELIK